MDLLPKNQTSPLAISDRMHEGLAEAAHCKEKDVPAKRLVQFIYDLMREYLAGEWASMTLMRAECNYFVSVQKDPDVHRFASSFIVDRQLNVVDRWLGH